jgi:hypothetical protein
MTSELMVRLAQTISNLMVHLAQTIHLSFNEIPDDPRHLGVPSVASKIVSEAMVRLAQTMQLSSIKISTITKWIEMSFHLILKPRSAIRFIRNDLCAYGTIGANRAPILHRNEISHDPRHLGVPSATFKMISEPVVHSTQTMHLSCILISTISHGLNRAST